MLKHLLALLFITAWPVSAVATTIVFDICDGARCESHRITDEDASMMSCVVLGQQIVIKWKSENMRDSWSLKKWRCYTKEPPMEASL